MALGELNRREFLLAGAAALAVPPLAAAKGTPKPVVGIVRIKNDRIEAAVEEAIDLLGGIRRVTRGKGTILLKPNLVSSQRTATTKPEVVRALARLMRGAGKEVSIGEGSAAAPGFNVKGMEIFRTCKRDILDPMQQHVFDQLGYMVRANKLGLVVVDGSMAMEGNGPSSGSLVKMDVIVAGENPVATDMVAAGIMGFEPNEVPTFEWANRAGLKPASLDEIEVRGEPIDRVRRTFARPQLMAWNAIRPFWGAREI